MQSRFVYAIFSHGKLEHVLRLVRTIRALSPQSFIVMHHGPSIPSEGARRFICGRNRDSRLSIGVVGSIRRPTTSPYHALMSLNNLEFGWYINLTDRKSGIYSLKAPIDALR